MFEEVPYSCLSMVITSATCLPGGTKSDTSSVPRPSFLPRTDSAFLSRKRSSEVRFSEAGEVLTSVVSRFEVVMPTLKWG